MIKKIFSLVLVLVLMMGIAIPAFADDESNTQEVETSVESEIIITDFTPIESTQENPVLLSNGHGNGNGNGNGNSSNNNKTNVKIHNKTNLDVNSFYLEGDQYISNKNHNKYEGSYDSNKHIEDGEHSIYTDDTSSELIGTITIEHHGNGNSNDSSKGTDEFWIIKFIKAIFEPTTNEEPTNPIEEPTNNEPENKNEEPEEPINNPGSNPPSSGDITPYYPKPKEKEPKYVIIEDEPVPTSYIYKIYITEEIQNNFVIYVNNIERDITVDEPIFVHGGELIKFVPKNKTFDLKADEIGFFYNSQNVYSENVNDIYTYIMPEDNVHVILVDFSIKGLMTSIFG